MDFRLLFWLGCASGYKFLYRARSWWCFAELCTVPVPWLSQQLWAHPIHQEQQALCCTYKWAGFDSYHWQEKKRDGECYNAALPFFLDSLNECSLCICWQNHSVQNKSSSVTHQERVHLSASSMAMPHCKGLREVVLGFGGELLLSN